MIPVQNSVLFADAIACLQQHKREVGREFKGRFIQIFLGMKFFQNSIPSMYSGSFISPETLQSLFDDLFSKISRAPNNCVLSIFEGRFLARTGIVGLGNSTAQNTWRNNLNIQKGIGCYAPSADLSSPTFLDQHRLDCRHLQVAAATKLESSRCSLCPSGVYRNESHRKWLRIDPAGSGYAATDLQNTANFEPYVAPGGVKIPVFPLIVAIYHDADPGLVIGNRPIVTLADFAADFNFSSAELSAYFDSSMTNPLNAQLRASHGWSNGAGLPLTVQAPSITYVSKTRATKQAAVLPQPILGGTPTPPPNTNNGWDAEQYVASALTAAGWVVYIVSRQQLGYDLFAQRGQQKRYVEVKSSLGLCSPSLTAREWQQANHHATSYVLAILENFNPVAENVVHWVRDPANSCAANAQTTVSHSISRSAWAVAAVPLANI